jgi:DNA-binding transcriptional MerR regulator/methylmalonyl-CoA mutase cobalamin-binding subunit
LTQVEAPRLRAWERRYAILTPHRSVNSYRLYSERDIAVIRWLREQVEAGMTISQAAAYLRNLGTEDRIADLAPAPLVGLTEAVQRLVLAAQHLDEAAANHELRGALATYTVEEVCHGLITPALVATGEIWAHDHRQIIPEHFLSQVVRAQLEALWHVMYLPEKGPLIVVACVPEEQHEIGALMLALFLRRQGLRVAFLGPNNEATSLTATAKALQPSVICLSVTLPEHHAQALAMAERLARETQVQVFVGGQACSDAHGNGHGAGVNVSQLPTQDAITAIKRSLAAS